jgi:hypothetical protein
MSHELITVGDQTFTILTESSSPGHDQLEVWLQGTHSVLWGERFGERLWLWSAAGRQIAVATLGQQPTLLVEVNPVMADAVEAAVQSISARWAIERHDQTKAA